MRLTVSVVTSDAAIATVFREVVSEYSPVVECDLHIRPEHDSSVYRTSDVCVLDFSTGVELPADADWGRKCFVLVRPEEAGEFGLRYKKAAESALLKPPNRAALRGVIAQVIASMWQERPEASRLRSDRDELLQYLIYASFKLQEHDEQRTNLLSRAAHDLGTPAMALTGYCGLLLEEHLGPLTPHQKDVLQRMLRSVRRSARLAHALSELGPGRNGDAQPNLRAADIRECVADGLRDLAQVADEKGIETFVDLDPPTGLLYFNPAEMQEVIAHLLENACRFTPRNGWIQVKGYSYYWERRRPLSIESVERETPSAPIHEPNAYRVDVQDSGPGIRPERLTLLFEDSIPYDGREDRSGAGLGLAICKRIITQHRGRIWADSKTDGASFSFALPMETETRTALF